MAPVPEQNAAERQIARRAEGATLEEIYAEQVAAGEPVGGASLENEVTPRCSPTRSGS